VGDGDDHQFVGLIFLHELVEVAPDGVGRPEDPAAAARDRRRRRTAVLEEAQRGLDRRNWNQVTLAHQRERHARARRQPPRLFFIVRAQRPRGDDDVGSWLRHRWLEPIAVLRDDVGAGGADEVGERVGQSGPGRPHAALR